MTMHLVHPSLSMGGKKKGTKKFASSAAKQKHLQLEQEWAQLKKHYGAVPEEKNYSRAVGADRLSYSLQAPPGRETRRIASLVTPGGNATRTPDKVYSGTNMIGIGQLHKSNAVPVFRNEDINDIARMRR